MKLTAPRKRLTNRISTAAAALALSAAFIAAPAPAKAQKVYVGSANGWDAMIAHPEQWSFVRKHADGFYVNFIQMLKPDPKKCAQTAALFTHKNAYYESDSRYTGLGGFLTTVSSPETCKNRSWAHCWTAAFRFRTPA